MQLSQVVLGNHHIVEPVILRIREGADVVVNSLVILGEAKELHIIIDGSLSCGRLTVAQGFVNVLIAGKGHIEVTSFAFGFTSFIDEQSLCPGIICLF